MKKIFSMIICAAIFITTLPCIYASAHDISSELRFMDADVKVQGKEAINEKDDYITFSQGGHVIFKNVDFSQGVSHVEIYAGLGDGYSGEYEIRADSLNGTVLATVSLKINDWYLPVINRVEVKNSVSGIHDLYVINTSGFGNLHHIKFDKIYKNQTGFVEYTDNALFKDIQESPYQYEVNAVAALGLMDGIEDEKFKPNLVLSRANFAGIAFKLLLAQNMATEQIFEDVPADNPVFMEINALANLGYVKKDTYFRPNDFITPLEAATILVRILGYEDTENAVLLGGLTSENVLRRDVAAKLLFKAINYDFWEVASYSNGQADYTKGTGILHKTRKINKGEGIVTVNAITSLTDCNYTTSADTVEINGHNFDVGQTSAGAYLGLNCMYFYDEDDTLVAILPEKRITHTIIDSNTFNEITFDDNEILYYNENNKKTTLEYGPKTNLIYNYKTIDSDLSELLGDGPFKGTVRWIDNDNDDIADTVFIDQYENIEIESVDSVGNQIIAKQNGQRKVYKLDKEWFLTIDGKDSPLEFINQFDSGIIYQSKNSGSKFTRIYILRKSVEGTVNAVFDDYIEIDGASYKVDDYLKNSISAGMHGAFYLNEYNEIIKFEFKNADSVLTGCLIDVGFYPDGSEENICIKVLGMDNKITSYQVNEKALIDGSKTSGADEIFNGSTGGFVGLKNVELNTPIRYRLNAENKIVMIDTYLPGENNKNDTLKRLTADGRIRFKYLKAPNSIVEGPGTAESKIVNALAADTKIFKLWYYEDQALYKWCTIDEMANYENGGYVDIYSEDPQSDIGSLIVWSEVGVSTWQDCVLVSGVSQAVDEDGNLTYIVNGYQGNKNVSLMVNAIAADENAKYFSECAMGELNGYLSKGDYIKYTLDASGKISSISVRFIHDGREMYTANSVAKINKNNPDTSSGTDDRQIFANVVKKEDNFLKISLGKTDSKQYEYLNVDSAKILRYDENEGTIDVNLSANDICVGDKIVAWISFGVVKQIVIYKSEF